MNKITKYLFSDKHQPREIEWFRRALYVFIIYKMLTYLGDFEELFSKNKLIFQSIKHINFITDSVYFLNNNYSVLLAFAFISIVILLSLVGILKRSNYLTNFVLWFCVINISNFLYAVQTGGDYILNQLLLFNCFLLPVSSHKLALNDIKNALHNSALIAIKIQVCLAYLIAGYYKLIDASWLSGSAVYETFQVPEFSNSLFKSIPYSITVILTYLTMIYQLSFPFLVWFRSFKIYLFSFGVLQHLLIALGVGLVSFGFVMIICYILFLKYDYSSSNLTANG